MAIRKAKCGVGVRPGGTALSVELYEPTFVNKTRIIDCKAVIQVFCPIFTDYPTALSTPIELCA